MELLRNPVVAGLVGATAFVGFLFGLAAVVNFLHARLARPERLSPGNLSTSAIEDELVAALRQTAQKLRTRRFFRPAVEDICIPRQRPHPPAPESAVVAAERALGRRLPSFLRRVYLEVSNGEFGPAYGLIGVVGGATDSFGKDIAATYNVWHHSPNPANNLAPGLLPLFELGCAGFLCVDLDSTTLPVFEVWPVSDLEQDPDDDAPIPVEVRPFSPSLGNLFAQWVQGAPIIRRPDAQPLVAAAAQKAARR